MDRLKGKRALITGGERFQAADSGLQRGLLRAGLRGQCPRPAPGSLGHQRRRRAFKVNLRQGCAPTTA